METPIRVLLIEDSESDAALIIHQLKKAGYAVTQARVETAAQMRAALEKQPWDCVIADYKLPQFDAPAALAVLQATGLDLPFIVVSGTIGEEIAVTLMKAGAHDYMMKDNLTRLPPAIRRELAEAQNRRERRQAEEALRANEEKFRSLFESSSDALMTLEPPAWRFTSGNPAALTMFRAKSVDELLAYAPGDLSAEQQPDGRASTEKSKEMIEKAMREGSHLFEWTHKRITGEEFPASVLLTRMTYAGKQILQTTVRDITERKQAEEALRESEEHYRLLVETLPDGVIVHSQGRVLFSNPASAAIMGMGSLSDLAGKPVIEFVHPDYRELALQRIQQSLQEGVPAPLSEEKFVRLDGTPIDVEVAAIPMTYAGKRAMLTVFTDITARKRAEEALRENEEKFRNLFNNSEVGMFRTRLDGSEILEFNEKYLKIINYTREEVAGKPSKTIWADKNERDRMVRTLNAEGQVTDFEFDVLNKQGAVRRCLTSLRLYREAGILEGSIIDITERKQAEAALLASEVRYRRLFEAAKDGILLLDAETGMVVDVNPFLVQLLGFSHAEFLGKKIWELGFLKDVVASQANFAELQHQSYVRYEDLPLETKAGRQIEVEFVSNVYQVNHHAVIQCNIRDITERKQAEDKLRYQASLLENVSDAIVASDAEARLTAWNAAAERLYGWKAEEVLGRKTLEVLQTAWSGAQAQDMQSAIEAQGQWRGEVTQARKDGSRVSIEMSSLVQRDTNGQITGYISVNHDITERKQAEEALRESEERFSKAFRFSPMAISIVRAADGRFIDVNDVFVKTSGYTREEILGHTSNELQLWANPERRAPRLQELQEQNSATASEFNLRTKFGELRVGLAATASIDLGGEKHYLSLIQDITERKRSEEALNAKVVALQMLADIDQAIISSLDLDQVLLTLLEKVCDAAQAEACSVALIDQASGDLVFRQAVGGATQAVIGLRLQLGEGLAGWVAQHRQSVLVPDAASDARSHKINGSSGFVTRDLIGVPLMAHEVVTGVIELINKRSGKFNEDDRILLEAVAAQAVIAIENARLFEIERAGREQLETLYRVGQAINSTLEADTILDRLTDEAMHVTHATHGSALVVRPDRGHFERRSLRGYSPEQGEQGRTDELALDRGINGRAYHSRQPVYVRDVQTDPDYHPLVPETRSELVVPILRGGQVIGNLDLQSPEVDAFREVNLAFLQALTDQVAIALENARLFEETRRHMNEMSILAQVALVGAAGRPYDETIARSTDALSRLWPASPSGFWFVDETGQSLHHQQVEQSPSPSFADIPIDQGITGWAMHERQPIRVGDVTADPRYHLTTSGIRSMMVAPLVVGQRAIGAVVVGSSRVDAFSGDDLRLLTTLAGQLATIFEKARLDAELAGHAARLEQRVAERTRELSVANEQLQELDHLKDQFVSNVSHELRTPLANLKLYLSLLDRGKPEKRAEYMQTLRREQQRLDRMIEDLLDLSRLDQGVTSIQPVPAELNLLLSQIIADRSALAAEHGLVLDYQPDEALPLALIDPVMLTEVITNLVGNAINYTPAGGMVTVSTAAREGAGQRWATFTVHDTGLGISAKDLPHLFERFYRGEVGRKASAPGTGLGLAISKEIVKKMGGHITVASEPGHGAAFTVWLRPAA